LKPAPPLCKEGLLFLPRQLAVAPLRFFSFSFRARFRFFRSSSPLQLWRGLLEEACHGSPRTSEEDASRKPEHPWSPCCSVLRSHSFLSRPRLRHRSLSRPRFRGTGDGLSPPSVGTICGPPSSQPGSAAANAPPPTSAPPELSTRSPLLSLCQLLLCLLLPLQQLLPLPPGLLLESR
ncbi:unnamed protein product, partial [Ectocarpus sp. 6 AP-2014]